MSSLQAPSFSHILTSKIFENFSKLSSNVDAAIKNLQNQINQIPKSDIGVVGTTLERQKIGYTYTDFNGHGNQDFILLNGKSFDNRIFSDIPIPAYGPVYNQEEQTHANLLQNKINDLLAAKNQSEASLQNIDLGDVIQANKPDLLSIGIPALIILGGIAYLLLKR